MYVHAVEPCTVICACSIHVLPFKGATSVFARLEKLRLLIFSCSVEFVELWFIIISFGVVVKGDETIKK